ncbi:MAG: dihydroorotase [Alphaproteobacteria bacterium]|nr:dihydroorotase [Alphaproteobacteria bacterium]
MSTSFTLPKWYDLHVHLRQGGAMAAYIEAQLAMGCAGILAMPNTKPPVSRVFEREEESAGWSIESYLEMIRAAGGDQFSDIIVPLYLTAQTTPHMIEEGAKAGILRACKYYPPHGTTGAEFGSPLAHYCDNGVLAAMEKAGVILCVHGEEHGLSGGAYFGRSTNAEEIFYRERLPRVAEEFPSLKIVCEHVTTKTAVDFVNQAGPNIAASVTPQHLLYTVADLLQGLKYHLYCLPLLKFEDDLAALREAVTAPDNTKFFAGTDSAPHTVKATDCGCAAGCFTGGIAPQLYAQAFEEAGQDLSQDAAQGIFKRFLCENGPAFYGLDGSQETFTLTRKPSSPVPLETPEGTILPLPLGLNQTDIPWSITL